MTMSFFKLGRNSKAEKTTPQASEKSQLSDTAGTSSSSGWPNLAFSMNVSTDASSSSHSSSSNKPSNNGKQKSLHSILKTSEKEYKTKLRDAEKTRDQLLKEADKIARKEREVIKAKKDKADKEAKDEFYGVKDRASEIHVRTVLDAVKLAILDVKERQQREQMNVSATAQTSALDSITTDTEVKKLIDYAAETVQPHMTYARFQQRLLDEVLAEVTRRQQRSQQDAAELSLKMQRELEQQIQETRLQLQQQALGGTSRAGESALDETPPPSYDATVKSKN
ncbi:hypothetical protein EDD21DRAFT_120888 [Dissophora ornata]|nr:hypothetical protein BGZ58_008084 [Dissophora ornata]KAI8600948.1 hypothetical protein EDD21DRAFT_120888 [Dissophora ornata]